MSIPGFGGDENPVEDLSETNATTFHLEGKSEWRFEVPFKTILSLKVTEGVGEIFGTELPLNVPVQLTGVKYALYAPLPEGCTVEYSTRINRDQAPGSSDSTDISEYISEDTPMNQYINLHMALESYRQETADYNYLNPSSPRSGPRVLILGNRSAGKTALARILSSYAYKMDHHPVLVNLNPRDGVFSLPGSLTATPISDTFDLESANGYGGTTTSGSAVHNPKQPVVKNFGFLSPTDNLELYKYQVSKLGVVVMSRLEEDADVRNSGVIIDTPALNIKDINVMENIVSDFEVNVVVVVDNERLLIDLRKKFKHKISNSQLAMVKIPKSGGVVELDDSFIRQCQEETIKEYFNGDRKTPLSPFKTEVDVKDFRYFKGVLSLDFNPSLSFLPSGDSYTTDDMDEDRKKDENSMDKFYTALEDPDASKLENLIIAITQLPQNNKQPKDLLNTCVLGYIHVSRVDEARGKMKVLSPMVAAIPRNILLVTTIGYTE